MFIKQLSLLCLLSLSKADTPSSDISSLGASYDIEYDSAKKALKFTVETKDNTYLSIGFSSGMTNTDMVYFKATGNGEVQDLWSTGNVTPQHDSKNDYTDTTVTKADDKYKFVTYRKLDTGDTSQDTKLECDGKTKKWAWAHQT